MFYLQSADRSSGDSAATKDGGTPVIINVSPLSDGHVLMVPDRHLCLPQVLTEKAIRIGVETVLLSSHPHLVVGFNSLCGLASVNHQHIHAWYR